MNSNEPRSPSPEAPADGSMAEASAEGRNGQTGAPAPQTAPRDDRETGPENSPRAGSAAEAPATAWREDAPSSSPEKAPLEAADTEQTSMNETMPPLQHDESIAECTMEQVQDLSCPGLYINREISWLEFNSRVLGEALDTKQPLLEQLKFLCIFRSNLDEFFMIRVANVQRQYESRVPPTGPDRTPPSRQLAEIRRRTLAQLAQAQEHWNKYLLPHLQDRGVRLVRYCDLTRKQQKFLDQYFADEVFPALTPQAIDPSHPLSIISGLTLNFLVQLEDRQGSIRYARLKIPNNFQRLVFSPRNKEAKGYASLGFCSNTRDNDIILLETLVQQHLPMLFPGMHILNSSLFRITRNADVEIEEDEAHDLLEAVRDLVDQRRFGDVVRLEVSHSMPADMRRFLMDILDIKPYQVYRVKGPMAFSSLMSLYGLDRPGLKDEPVYPSMPPAFLDENRDAVFNAIRSQDMLLFHPYQSFVAVQDFVRRASEDPGVIAIKQTLYRVGRDSPIVHSLIEARRRGKQVTAVVELKARFDEASNIGWAEEMEKAGVHVVYGIPGMKIHAKLCLVVRREAQGVRRYVHIGSGNYNPSTAKIYSDMGLLTAHKGICSEVSELFNVMTGYAVKDDYRYLLVAPQGIRRGLVAGIRREVERHKVHGDGLIALKCNQLVDKVCIQELYKASQAGVRVRIQVRGVCCLRPGVPGVSDNIEVSSIVGRFLEHVRLYYFHNGGDAVLYMGSADIMPRNLDRRIEVLTPILDPVLRAAVVKDVLWPHLDDPRAYELQDDGSYVRRPGQRGTEVQYRMLEKYGCLGQ